MIQELLRYLLPIALAVVSTASARGEEPNSLLVFVSAFAAVDGGGIHAYRLHLDTGELKLVHRTTEVKQPFFLALSRDRRFLYATEAPGEFGGKQNEQVASLQLADDAGQ